MISKVGLAFVFAVLLLSGCAAPPQQKTSLEIQAIQAKNFEAERRVAFNSVLSVLQDLGYIVGSASAETGFITAESPNKMDTSAGGVFSALAGVRIEQKTAVTAAVEELRPGNSRVRLNFVVRERRMGSYGSQAFEDTPISEPKMYNTAFEKIGEAIFIRKGQK